MLGLIHVMPMRCSACSGVYIVRRTSKARVSDSRSCSASSRGSGAVCGVKEPSTKGPNSSSPLVVLPVDDKAQISTEAVLEPQIVDGDERILLVEDEDGVRKVVSRILTRHGYQVTSFSDGVEALEFYRSHLNGIDLLLTDVVMPKTSGKTLSDEATTLNASLKTLYMSGYTDELIAQRGVLAEGENLLQKPFKAEQLLLRVRLSLDSGEAA